MIPNVVNRWKRHPFLDAGIYHLSHKHATYDALRFSLWLSLHHPTHISQFAPILIGGCPRSGTTLARALIGCHPDIASPSEEYNIVMYITNDQHVQKTLGLIENELQTLRARKLDLISRAETILYMYLKQQQKPQVALKHPLHVIILKQLFHHFPHMKFIHVIRDGRDTVCSLRTHPKRRIKQGKIVPNPVRNPYKWCVRQWVSCVLQGSAWQLNPNYLEIRYEDLVNNTIPTMDVVFKFLELSMIEKQQLLGFYQQEQAEKHLQNIEVGQPIYQKTIGRWQRDMTKKEQQIFKRMAGDLLIQLGYVTDNSW
jgi:protein-tyrosine sulfotransferase